MLAVPRQGSDLPLVLWPGASGSSVCLEGVEHLGPTLTSSTGLGAEAGSGECGARARQAPSSPGGPSWEGGHTPVEAAGQAALVPRSHSVEGLQVEIQPLLQVSAASQVSQGRARPLGVQGTCSPVLTPESRA